MHIGDTIVDWQMAWARGSRESTNNAGLKGQPWHADLDTGNKEEEVRPVKTRVEGLEYITLIIPMKVLPKPITSKPDHKNDHSSLSKAFIASRVK